MALIVKDRVQETTTTSGTGTITLAGAVSGFQSFAAIGNGNTTYYTIVDGTSWEVGIGTYTSAGTTLSRDTVLSNSLGTTAKISLSGGTAQVFVTYAAGKSVYQDASNNVVLPGTVTSTGEITPSVTASSTDLTLSAISTGAIVFNTLNGTAFRVIDTGGSATNYWRAMANGAAAIFRSLDSVANAQIQTNGTGSVLLGTNAGVTQAAISHTASAVNYVQVTGSATGGQSSISAQGSDATTNIQLAAKGGGNVVFSTNGAGSAGQFLVSHTSNAVNYYTATGGAAGFAPRLFLQGSDTNISMAFQPKGTGAIDLASGSSGVNISNGGTVTAITRTANGSGYTSVPSVAITAPTTAGGVQATATCTVGTNAFAVSAGGTGYTVGDTLTVVGGTGTAATFTVATLSGSAVATVTAANAGSYSVVPTNPVSTTGGTGSGCTINITGYSVTSGGFTITNAGSGYIEQPTVTFSGGGGSGAAAYATVGSGTVIRSLGNTMDLYAPSGIGFRIGDGGATTTGYWTAYPNTSSPSLRAIGSSSGQIATGSAVPIQFLTNATSSSVEQLRVSHTASAVNYVQVTGGATTANPVISVQGSDGTRGLNFTSKGSSYFNLYNQAGTTQVFAAGGANASNGNWVSVVSGALGFAPAVTSAGGDTNIDLALTPKGTGVVRANGTALSAENGIILNKQTVAANVSVSSGYSAHSAGPVTVSSGVSVTIASGSRWVVI